MQDFDLQQIPTQQGKIAIVTGANIGLGYNTTIGLASKGFKVIMACRNLDKANQAKANILAIQPKANLEIIPLDLNSLNSVKAFAVEYTSRHNRLDVLVNNAGIMVPPFGKTKDGFESQMGVNYFGHFLLTNLLFDTLKATEGARIVSLSSIAHKSGKIDFENLNAEKRYTKFEAYSQSKLACLMFSNELSRRISKSGLNIKAVAAHPGVSDTNLGQYLPKWVWSLAPLMRFMIHKPEAAAQPSLMAALADDVKNGDYIGPKGLNQMVGKPHKTWMAKHAKDEAVAAKLWKVSEELTQQTFTISA